MKYIKELVLAVSLLFALSSCEKDLDRNPFYEETAEDVYADFANYKRVLSKCYAGLALSGQQGGDGMPDISGIDGGMSNYLRQYFQLQELTTDEAVIAWSDTDLPNLHRMDWGAANIFVNALYSRIFYQIAVCNEFIRETSDEKLSERGIMDTEAGEARLFRNEARFLRALSYYHALDMFGNVPFVTEEHSVGNFFPEQIARADLFAYIEAELKDLENLLAEARNNEYGRADRAAVWTLLARLYLNAEVYIGENRYADVIAYCDKVIGAGYSLEPEYAHLFLADNHDNHESIFAVAFDGMRTRTFGGTNYIIHAAIGGGMNASNFGVNGGWGGLRTTSAIVELFPTTDASVDKRGLFYTEGQALEINDVTAFTDGYPITKWKNITSEGVAGSDPSGEFVDTDFPMFRLADVYLMYAEATLRGGGGNQSLALQYVNDLRARAYGNDEGAIVASSLTLDFILDERARELNWEAYRRTDLIRFDRFTSDSYVWSWKGGVKEGTGVASYRNLFPIPSNDLSANPNLIQNQGY